MSPLDLNYPTTAGLNCYNKAEPQEKDLKIIDVQMIEIHKEEMNESSKGKDEQKLEEMNRRIP